MTATPLPLTSLEPGMPIVVGGDRVVHVDDDLAAAFGPGDALLVVDDTGDLLHLPATQRSLAADAVGRARRAFAAMGEVDDAAITTFYHAFADRLADDEVFAPVAAANSADVDRARQRGRSTTRLVLDDRMRADMVAGLRSWADAPPERGRRVDHVDHPGWSADAVRDGLGVVAFVFEGRPNVFADATGVLRSGNTVVFRIGSDALGTARALVGAALDPALASSGLPPGAVTLLDSPTHAAGWAMFADPRLGLAVARGSGAAVAQLGAIARAAGNPVSLHGTGGAWMVATGRAEPERLAAAVAASLDRKVCNTLNTVVVTADAVATALPAVLAGVDAAATARAVAPRLHVRVGDLEHLATVDPDRLETRVAVSRADGIHDEPAVTELAEEELGTEWEWEDNPEVTVAVVDDLDAAIELHNAHAPRFVASLLSADPEEQDRFFALVDAPFVGNGFTRWVDGQYALDKPELGLSNWQFGRLFGRAGILSGDSVHTVRLRVDQSDPNVHR
ncbi:glutamate-5-semialdehyde dehydrogenase [Salsipaludibacter albus]|uniref:glutamate-5-semialdehyde dehydrogenase n=1 Tax=Salsipaludibacter albus TaxID=2849650 RepID=UPI001EE439C1|nr:glutamate-5-semialdehyde dehydrogenase [Salsipaludibacter albus]MBY5163914.1 glutamate-5-semialdehyde dehydrogenase [Salsipaludibacter albus]